MRVTWGWGWGASRLPQCALWVGSIGRQTESAPAASTGSRYTGWQHHRAPQQQGHATPAASMCTKTAGWGGSACTASHSGGDAGGPGRGQAGRWAWWAHQGKASGKGSAAPHPTPRPAGASCGGPRALPTTLHANAAGSGAARRVFAPLHRPDRRRPGRDFARAKPKQTGLARGCATLTAALPPGLAAPPTRPTPRAARAPCTGLCCAGRCTRAALRGQGGAGGGPWADTS